MAGAGGVDELDRYVPRAPVVHVLGGGELSGLGEAFEDAGGFVYEPVGDEDGVSGQVRKRAVKETVHELMTLWIEDRNIRPASLALYTRTSDKHLGSSELLAKNPVRVERVQAAVEPDDVPAMKEIQAVIDRARVGGATYTEIKSKGEEPRKLVLRPDPMFADMLTVAAFTGLRIGELCGLLVEEVNLDLGVVQVRKQLDKRPPHERVALKAKNSRRNVPISVELRPVLERLTAGRMSLR